MAKLLFVSRQLAVLVVLLWDTFSEIQLTLIQKTLHFIESFILFSMTILFRTINWYSNIVIIIIIDKGFNIMTEINLISENWTQK
jgi:hypothetical protein